MKLDPIITVTMSPAVDRVIETAHFAVGAHVRGTQRHRVAAGKGVNVSKALARLGVDSIATGFLGRDNAPLFESLLTDQLAAAARSQGPASPIGRVDLQFFDVPGQTRENVTLIDTTDKVETHVRDVGPAVGERDLLRLKRKVDLMSRAGALVVFSGGLPPGFAPEQLAQMAHICAAAGARVAVDVSGDALKAVRDEPLFLVKPNRQELADLLGGDVADDRAALLAAGRQLAERCEFVLLSLGSAGGMAFHGPEVLAGHVPLDPRRAVSTVGCGDCLLAGFIAGLRGGGFAEAYRLALAAATANVVAASPADLDHDALAEFAKLVELEKLP